MIPWSKFWHRFRYPAAFVFALWLVWLAIQLAPAIWDLPNLDPKRLGPFGDAFGAINALFSGLALAGVVAALLLQIEELGKQQEMIDTTRLEMKQSQREMREQSTQFKKQAAIAALQSFVQATAMRGEAHTGEIEQVAEGHPSGKQLYRVEPRAGADPREIVNQIATVTRIQIRIAKHLDHLLEDAFPEPGGRSAPLTDTPALPCSLGRPEDHSP